MTWISSLIRYLRSRGAIFLEFIICILKEYEFDSEYLYDPLILSMVNGRLYIPRRGVGVYRAAFD
jgi:hypothetical protein